MFERLPRKKEKRDNGERNDIILCASTVRETNLINKSDRC